MKKLVLLIMGLLLVAKVFSQSPTFYKNFDEPFADLAPALDGGYYLVAKSERLANYKFRITRLNEDGDVLWIRSYVHGPINYSNVYGQEMAITQSPDSSLWVANGDSIYKLNKNGDIILSLGHPFAPTSSGNCLKIGTKNNKVFFLWDRGSITAHDEQGNFLWIADVINSMSPRFYRQIKDFYLDDNFVYAIADSNYQYPITNASLTYTKVLKYEYTGNLVAISPLLVNTNAPFNQFNQGLIKSVVKHSDNASLYITGFMDVGPSQRQLHVQKLDENLNLQWSKDICDLNINLYNSTYSGALELIETSDGNLVAGGYVNAKYAFLAKFDTTGGLIWYKEYRLCSSIRQIIEAPDGGLVTNCFDNPFSAIGLPSIANTAIIKFDGLGDYPTSVIKGTVFVDANGDNILGANEIKLANRLVTVTPGPFHTFTDAGGNYEVLIPLIGNYKVAVDLPRHPYTDSLLLGVPTLDSIFDDNDFALSYIALEDLEVNIYPSPARAGFTQSVNLKVKNWGYVTTTAQPELKIVYDQGLASINTSSLPYTTLGDTLVLQLPNIPGMQTTEVDFTFDVALTTMGQMLTYWAGVSIPPVDSTPANNTTTVTQIIRNSYDPNNKLSYNNANSSQGYFTELDQELEYVINFQNTGNDSAYSILLVDTLDVSSLDVSSIEIIDGSHDFEAYIVDGYILKFLFQDIYLPDSATNPITSQGYVHFTLNAKEGLAHNTLVQNQVGIYFDLNPVVETNHTSNISILCDSVNKFSLVSNTACTGDSINAFYTGIGANELVWSNLSGNIGTNTSVGFVADSITTAKLSLYTSLGNCVGTTVDSVQVSYIPALGVSWQSRPLCDGDTALLVSTNPGSQWYNGTQPLSTGNDIAVTETGLYFASLASNGCESHSDTLSVVFDPIPAQPSINQVNNNLEASAAGSYQWYLDGVLLPDTAQVVTPIAEGNYTVVVTIGGCQSVVSEAFRYQTIGLNELTIDDVNLYPNPTTGKVTINIGGKSVKGSVEVYSILGELMLMQDFDSSTITLDLQGYPVGTYILSLKGESGNVRLLFVKE